MKSKIKLGLIFILFSITGTSCNYLEKVDWSIPEFTIYRDIQIISNPADSNLISMIVHRKVNTYHYRKLIYEYNVNDTIAHIAVDTTFGEIECIQYKQNGDILFSGIQKNTKLPGLFVYEKNQKKVRKVTNTPYLIHNFYLMSDDITIYFSDSTLNKVNRKMVNTESFILKTDTLFQKMMRIIGQPDVNTELVGLGIGKTKFSLLTYYKALDGGYSNSSKYFVVSRENDYLKEININHYFEKELTDDNLGFRIFPYLNNACIAIESLELKSVVMLDLQQKTKKIVHEASDEDRKKNILFEHLVWLDRDRFVLHENPWSTYYISNKKRLRLVNIKDHTSRVLTIHYEKSK